MNPFVSNFRDVGLTVNQLSKRDLLKTEVLYRGGKVEDIPDIESINSPRVIVNLRQMSDPSYEGVLNIHAPAPDSVEVYDITQGRNKKWISETLVKMFTPELRTPIYIHCALGKDRTGIMTAALLTLLGVSEGLIMEDYLLSKGTLKPDLIKKALTDLQDSHLYRKLDVEMIKASFLT